MRKHGFSVCILFKIITNPSWTKGTVWFYFNFSSILVGSFQRKVIIYRWKNVKILVNHEFYSRPVCNLRQFQFMGLQYLIVFWQKCWSPKRKFSFSEKATKNCAISLIWFWRLLSKCQNHEADCANIHGLLRKADL